MRISLWRGEVTRKPEGIGLPSAEVEGDEYQLVEAKFLPTNVTDIVARLKASIDQTKD